MSTTTVKAIWPGEKAEDPREKLWRDVCIAVAGSSNSTNITTPARWADEALKAYDARFPRAASTTQPADAAGDQH